MCTIKEELYKTKHNWKGKKFLRSSVEILKKEKLLLVFVLYMEYDGILNSLFKNEEELGALLADSSLYYYLLVHCGKVPYLLVATIRSQTKRWDGVNTD